MKAILVIDMPTKCYECPYASEKFCRLDMKKYPQGRKRKDCPLRPLPRKEQGRHFYTELGENTYVCGWNACIDEILSQCVESVKNALEITDEEADCCGIQFWHDD